MNARLISLFLMLLLFPISAGAQHNATFDARFWQHWSDGSAEISAYDLQQPRYGEIRNGVAVAIFVTEPFSGSTRVKTEKQTVDSLQVLKLNLVEDFPTGVYDYNLMTSSFVAITPSANLKPGQLAKASFSSQEWCGHTYAQIVPSESQITHSLHSYFEGEADTIEEVKLPTQWLAEDTLLHWARGFSDFSLESPGQPIQLLRSLKEARLLHRPLEFIDARTEISAKPISVTVPAGEFQVRRLAVVRADGMTWEFFVEQEFPHRIIRWSQNNGFRAELRGSKRIPYWQLNGLSATSYLAEIGLSPRLPATP